MVWSIIENHINNKNPTGLIIIGPTASGKTNLAIKLAIKYNGEIISCDSIQIYKDFNIGSAKPTLEEQKLVPHHLIDIIYWYENFDAAMYATLAREKIIHLQSKKKLPIITGGSGLYLRALLSDRFHLNLPKDNNLRMILNKKTSEQLYKELLKQDPKRAKQLHPNDKFRIIRALELITLNRLPTEEIYKNNDTNQNKINFKNFIIIYLNPPKNILLKQIEKRTQKMLSQGFITEVTTLLKQGCNKNSKPMQSIGYKQIIQMLEGKLSEKDIHQQISIATWHYAKKQKTWFNKINSTIVLTNFNYID